MSTNEFKTACGLLTRFSFNLEENPDYEKSLTFFPVVGLILGGGLWLVAVVLLWLAGPKIGTLFGAVGLPLLFWWTTRGKGLQGVIWFVEHSASRIKMADYGVYWQISLFQGLVLVKIVCTGLLLYFGWALWLLIVPVLSMAAFAQLWQANTISSQKGDKGTWFSTYGHWLIAGAVVLIAAGMMNAFIGGVCTVAIVWLSVPGLEHLLCAFEGELTENGRQAVMETVEILTLLLGVLFFLGR